MMRGGWSKRKHFGGVEERRRRFHWYGKRSRRDLRRESPKVPEVLEKMEVPKGPLRMEVRVKWS